jgi:predicted nucleic-acid-binding protein
MIGVDTNVLARYYVVDGADAEAVRQRPLAQKLIESSEQLLISKTVILELEWVMRGYYYNERVQFIAALQHLLSRPNIMVEDGQAVICALQNHKAGIAFADALHHASYRTCDSMASFDDRKFARRIAALDVHPKVLILR